MLIRYQWLMTLLSMACISVVCNANCACGQEPKPDAVPADHAQRVKAGTQLFQSSIRKLLETHCLNCHGGDSVKSDFDLSSRESLVASGMLGKSAEDSQLFAVVSHQSEPAMPFKAPKLSDESIELIRRWIDLGAPYDKPLVEHKASSTKEMKVTEKDQQHWAFRPLSTATLQKPPIETNQVNPIDQLLTPLRTSLGAEQNGSADARTLVRRAYFDLIGLPPTPEQIAEYVNDPSPDAWSKLIDQLLDSPRYGERWARHWMDVARFAESHGYEQDYDRPTAYHYRDFLIRAFNQDLPYDQFVRWQIAGDEIEPTNPIALMATGFLGAGAFPTQLTEAEFESARYDELDDMVMTTGVAFMGLSIGCARCHDHKFDPIPSRDYYRFAANFARAIRCEADLDLTPDENRDRQRAFADKLAQLKSNAATYKENQLRQSLLTWHETHDLKSLESGWQSLSITSVQSNAKTQFELLTDGSVLSVGTAPAQETITVYGKTATNTIRAIRLEALTHDSLPHRGPGRAPNGNFALGDFKVEIEGDNVPSQTPVKLTSARATHQQNTDSLSVAASIDADPISGWAIDQGGVGKDSAAVFDFEAPIKLPEATHWRITLTLNHPNRQHTLGRFRISFSDQTTPAPAIGDLGPGIAIRETLDALRMGKSLSEIEPAHVDATLEWIGAKDQEYIAIQKSIRELESAGPGLQLAKALITSEGRPHLPHHADDRGYPHFYPETYLLKRGDVHQKTEQVSPGFLTVLTPLSQISLSQTSRSNTEEPRTLNPNDSNDPNKDRETPTKSIASRSNLARWLTDPRQGAGALAARVMVNRVWQHHFGRGIVATPNDFGIAGDRPTHPELLEWLANDFVENCWQIKRLHKMIMTSEAYKQSGHQSPANLAADPDNKSYWHYAPRRLEAEAIRDSILYVSGLLDFKMYGPGTLDPNMTRRSVYFFIKRSQLIPSMMLFDWPEHLVSIGQRPVTTIAPQALLFLNNPNGRQWATAFAGRLPRSSDVAFVEAAWQMAFNRIPSSQELSFATTFLTQQRKKYVANGRVDGVELSYVDLCQTVLSMNEFVYID